MKGGTLGAQVHTFFDPELEPHRALAHAPHGRIIICGRYANRRRKGWLSTFHLGTNPRQTRNS
jgi:hypothetical protein